MANKTTVLNTYQVSAKIRAEVVVKIKANSFAEAIEAADKLSIHDYIKFVGEHFCSEKPVMYSIWKED